MRRTSKSSVFGGVIVIASIVVILAIVYGYFSNIYKLTQTDFEPNYKEEVFRAVGVVLPPVGIIVGYIDFEQTSQKE